MSNTAFIESTYVSMLTIRVSLKPSYAKVYFYAHLCSQFVTLSSKNVTTLSNDKMALVLRKNITVTKRKDHHEHILRELHHVCLENTKGNSGILMWKHLFPFSPSRHLSFPANLILHQSLPFLWCWWCSSSGAVLWTVDGSRAVWKSCERQRHDRENR